ncbi:unnamed protein product [Fusarium graminearum]|nr:unnamed protein product [Fusarium graminearum]CAG1963748.1 unnamed protein product [Fusarium graminearum]
MYSSCVMVTCTSSFGMFLHQEKQANYPDDVPYSMGMSSCCGLMTRSSVCSNRYISTWTGVQGEKKAILALRLASEPPRFRVVVGSCLVIVANFFRGFGPDLSNIVMAVHDCFFHLVEWIEYDETEPNWEVIWKVKSVCSGAMIDFADDNKQTCVSQLEGEGCIVWREVLSSFYDIFTYCEWPDLSDCRTRLPAPFPATLRQKDACLKDNQAAELLTALQHVERSEPERAQTIAVIEQLVRLQQDVAPPTSRSDMCNGYRQLSFTYSSWAPSASQPHRVDEVSLRPPNNMDDDVNPEMLGFYRRKTHTLGKEERASPRAHVARPMMGVSYLSTMGMSGLDNDLWISPHGHDDFRDKRVRSNVNLDLAEQLPILPTR